MNYLPFKVNQYASLFYTNTSSQSFDLPRKFNVLFDERSYTHIGSLNGSFCRFDLFFDRGGHISGSFWYASSEAAIYKLTGQVVVLPDGRTELQMREHREGAEIIVWSNFQKEKFTGKIGLKNGRKFPAMISKL